MDYANAQAGQATLSQMKPQPELGRLKAAAERISRAANNIDNFLDRFHGPRPEAANAAGGPTCDSYRNDLDSIFNALDRLENAVSVLDHIG